MAEPRAVLRSPTTSSSQIHLAVPSMNKWSPASILTAETSVSVRLRRQRHHPHHQSATPPHHLFLHLSQQQSPQAHRSISPGPHPPTTSASPAIAYSAAAHK